MQTCTNKYIQVGLKFNSSLIQNKDKKKRSDTQSKIKEKPSLFHEIRTQKKYQMQNKDKKKSKSDTQSKNKEKSFLFHEIRTKKHQMQNIDQIYNNIYKGHILC